MPEPTDLPPIPDAVHRLLAEVVRLLTETDQQVLALHDTETLTDTVQVATTGTTVYPAAVEAFASVPAVRVTEADIAEARDWVRRVRALGAVPWKVAVLAATTDGAVDLVERVARLHR